MRTLDLAFDTWSDATIDWAQAIAFSVPMHTALRLAYVAANRIASRRPHIPMSAYGLYAEMADSHPFERSIAGEYMDELLAWIASLSTTAPEYGTTTSRGRSSFAVPDREDLPSLDNYARLSIGSERRLAGAVETSHGCIHRCRHCPLPTVYDGRIRIVGHDVVLADVAQLVEAGAGHVTFADADFLNGPKHSMRIVEDVHRRWPHLTYDATIKVEHLLRHADLVPRLVETGCAFVVSAFETLNDEILSILDKGHTALEASEVVHNAASAGLTLRPTWLPFTPWTTYDDLIAMFSFIDTHDLALSTDPVQMSIRLLVPRTSLLADHPAFLPFRGPYNADTLGYEWKASDPVLDELATRLSLIAQELADDSPMRAFTGMWRETLRTGGLDESPADSIPVGGHPREATAH